MKRSRYTPERVTFALRQAEHGAPVVEVCRKMRFAEQTFYRWKKSMSALSMVDHFSRESPAIPGNGSLGGRRK